MASKEKGYELSGLEKYFLKRELSYFSRILKPFLKYRNEKY